MATLEERVEVLEALQPGNLRETAATEITEKVGDKYNALLTAVQAVQADLDKALSELADLKSRVTALE